MFLVPGILSILARGVATGCLKNDPKIFLWHWAGVSAIFTWSTSLILFPFIPISFCLTRTLFVQDEEEQASEGLDKVYMREIVISHFCNRESAYFLFSYLVESIDSISTRVNVVKLFLS